MDNKSECLVFFVISLFVLSNILMAKPANAQTTPNPSVPVPSIPEFIVKFVNASYDVPASSTINPYTGQNETSPSSFVENYSIQVIVKNQPFTPQWISEGTSGFADTLYYNVRMKGYFEDNWTELYNPNTDFPTQSNSDYTTVYSEEFNPNGFTANYQIDFEVQALAGAVHRGYNASATNQLDMYPYVFDGQTSAWSNTQILTIPASSVSPTPTVPELSPFVILPLFLSLFPVALAVIKQKAKATESLKKQFMER